MYWFNLISFISLTLFSLIFEYRDIFIISDNSSLLSSLGVRTKIWSLSINCDSSKLFIAILISGLLLFNCPVWTNNEVH